VKNAEKAKSTAPKKIITPSYVGWKQVAGWTEDDVLTVDEADEDLLYNTTVLENYLQDKYYGDWYHNAALLTATAFFSWIVTRLGGGLPSVFCIAAVTAIAFRTSVRKLRKNIREKVIREAAMRKLETDTETIDWLNLLMNKFWSINEPFIAEQAVTIGNQVLADAAPKFLSHIALDVFTLGTKPPRLNHVRTFPKTDEDIVVMDWMYSFTPNDSMDMTARQLKNFVDPQIQLNVGVGAGKFGVNFPIVIQNMSFSGLMRVRIKLVTSYPHIKTVDAFFITPPTFDYVLKPIGGRALGFDINSLPGFEGFVKSMVDSIIGPMLYSPNTFQVNVQELLAGAGGDSAAGVLAVTIFGANGIKSSEAMGNTVDPYVIFSLNNRNELARSKTQRSTKNPRWNETKYILVQNVSEALTLSVFDFNDFRKDKFIGMATYPLESIVTKPDQENLTLEILGGNKSRGSMNASLHWFPVLEGRKLDDGTVEPPPESNTGIVKIVLHQVKDLDTSQSLVGQYTPYADLLYNGELLHQTKHVKRNNNPVWDESHEFLVTDRRKAKIALRIKDSRDLGTDPVLGIYKGRLDSMLHQFQAGHDWFDLNTKGRVRASITWKPIALKGSAASKSYAEPIGVIRVHCIQAGDELRNLETIGKVDPYIRVMVNGFQKARTIAVSNTLAPLWDEVLYIPVQSSGQRMVIEAMDAENIGSDRTLGTFELDTGDFIKTNEKGEYIEYIDAKQRTGQFHMKKKGPKGTLIYTLSFFPAVNVMDPDEAEEQRKEAEKKIKEAEAAAASDEKAKDEKKTEKPEGKEAAPAPETEQDEPAAKDIPLKDLIQNESGVMAVTLLDAKLYEKDVYLRISVDDAFFPAFTSPKLAAGSQLLSDTGELLIRELSWSQVTFQITSKPKGLKKDDFIASYKIATLNLLKKAYHDKYQIHFKDGDKLVAILNVRARYFPLLMELDPSESINNMGELQGEIIKAENVPAADRSGYSDPYSVVQLNGEKVFKTKTVKKTLNPVWNEQFNLEILSRTKSKLLLQVWDWDLGPTDDDFLGDVYVDLSQLEPLVPTTLTLPLRGESGTITARFLFKPSYVSRQVDSSGMGATFANGAAAPGKLLGSAIGGAGDVAGGALGLAGNVASTGVGAVAGVGNGLKSGASKLKGTFRRSASNTTASTNATNSTSKYGDLGQNASNLSVNTGPQNNLESPSPGLLHRRTASMRSNVSGATNAEGAIAGQIRLNTITGFDGVSSVLIKTYIKSSSSKEKEIHKSKTVKVASGGHVDETFGFKADATAQAIVFKVKEHKSLGRTEDLGEATVSLTEVTSGALDLDVGQGHINVSITV
jgi:Ca2+-dependent lipid-binding protein